MVCKKLKEDDIKRLFQPFGPIEDCSILRDDSGVSRGQFEQKYTINYVHIAEVN